MLTLSCCHITLSCRLLCVHPSPFCHVMFECLIIVVVSLCFLALSLGFVCCTGAPSSLLSPPPSRLQTHLQGESFHQHLRCEMPRGGISFHQRENIKKGSRLSNRETIQHLSEALYISGVFGGLPRNIRAIPLKILHLCDCQSRLMHSSENQSKKGNFRIPWMGTERPTKMLTTRFAFCHAPSIPQKPRILRRGSAAPLNAWQRHLATGNIEPVGIWIGCRVAPTILAQHVELIRIHCLAQRFDPL